MVRALDHLEVDLDAALLVQLLHQTLNRIGRHQGIFLAMDDQARGRAGREEAEVVHVGRQRQADKAMDLGPPHQQLHADPGAEREAGDPAGAAVDIVLLHPVEGRGGIAQLALAMVEGFLGATNTAKIEAQGGESATREHVKDVEHDLVVHRAAVERVRMEDQCQRCIGATGMVITPFQAAVRTVEDHLRHRCVSSADGLWGPMPTAPAAHATRADDVGLIVG